MRKLRRIKEIATVLWLFGKFLAALKRQGYHVEVIEGPGNNLRIHKGGWS